MSDLTRNWIFTILTALLLIVGGIAAFFGKLGAQVAVWALSIVLLAAFGVIGYKDAGRPYLKGVTKYFVIAILFFGGFWFVKLISPSSPLTGFVWPFVAIAIALIFVFNVEQIGSAFRQTRVIIRKVKFGGIEVEIDRAAVDRVERELSNSIRQLFDSIAREYRRQVRIRKVDQLLSKTSRLLPSIIFPSDNNMQGTLSSDRSVRCTIHVPDIVLDDFMYQLTDYAGPSNKKGAGRRFSKRRGIIGLAWRLKESRGQGDVFHGHADKDRQLVEGWGMFEAETGPALQRPSCLAVMLTHDGREVGLLYIDSTQKDAFGNDQASLAAAQTLERSAEVKELAESVAEVDLVMRELALNLDLAKIVT